MLCAVFACTEEKLQEDQNNLESVETLASANAEGPCVVTNLVAGQHYVAGSVTVDIEGDNLIITYTSNSDWIIGTTHKVNVPVPETIRGFFGLLQNPDFSQLMNPAVSSAAFAIAIVGSFAARRLDHPVHHYPSRS